MNGVIVFNKEKNMTSRDVVNKLNHIFQMKKIGHTGTLDPIATGVLVICLGKYTKLVDLLTALDKEYIASVKLGIKTDTLDITGNIIETKDYLINEKQLKEVLNSFLGKSIQEVPLYSAVKIKGKKLYEYARNNIEIELPKREIEVHDIELISYNNDEFTFRVKVSKGTYIRSLINDICLKLNTVGVMKELTRTKQGKFNLKNSFTFNNIENNNFKLLNIEDVLDYQVINLNDMEYFRVKNGNFIEKALNDNHYILKYNNEVIAIYEFKNKIGKAFIMLKI